MNSALPTVHVVDGERDLRHGLQQMLRHADVHVFTHASADQFLDAYDPRESGCLIADLYQSGEAGSGLQRQLASLGASLPVIMLSGEGDVSAATAAMRQGALDVIVKPVDAALLLERVRHAIQLDVHRRRCADRIAKIKARVAGLTPRERQVLELVVAGRSSRLIARQFGVSVRTVDVHRARVMKKMQVRSIARLAIDAAICGVVPLDDAPEDRG